MSVEVGVGRAAAMSNERADRTALARGWIALISIAMFAFAGNANAQRASMADLQAQIDALEAAYCADVSSSASFCPPPPASCTCSLGTPYPAGASCTEVAAGDYEVAGDVTYTVGCAGQCSGGSVGLCNDDGDCTEPNEYCNTFTNSCFYDIQGIVACTSNEQCPGTSTCFQQFSQGTCSGSGEPCVTSLLCPQGETCGNVVPVDFGTCAQEGPDNGLLECTTASDCAPGMTCSDLGDGTLRCIEGTACGVSSCPSGGTYNATYFSITNVGEAGSGDIATCDATTLDADSALVCVGLIESDLGTSCVPFP